MKKIFTLVVAAFAAVAMSAEPVVQEISLDETNWGWGWFTDVTADDGGLLCEFKENPDDLGNSWGAMATGWDPEIDLTEWDKLVVVVDNIEGPQGTWWYIKAFLRDYTDAGADEKTLHFDLSLDHDPTATNYLVLEMKNAPAGFDLTKVRMLGIQAQFPGTKCHISRAFLQQGEDEDPTEAVENISVRNNGIRYNLLGQEVGEDYKGIVIMNGKKMIVR